MLENTKRTWAEINLSAINCNYRSMREKLPENCKFMGVVKADAYGHGAVPIAGFLEKAYCDYLAVAFIDEAEELRNAGNKLPILILGATPVEFVERLTKLNVTQTVSNLETAREYSEALSKLGEKLKIHIKLETGMGRLGFNVKNGDVNEVVSMLSFPNLEAEGIYTHFSVSDEPSKDEYTHRQFRVFCEAVDKIEKEAGVDFAIRHCVNSGAMVNYPKMYLDMVRPGLALYGMYPGAEKGDISLSPAMELKSRIAAVTEHEAGDCISYGAAFTADKKMRIAVLPIGYADGLHRVLSNKIDVLIHGRRCRQIGRICMDMCMVDVTEVPDAKAGDVATIFGQDGEESISVNELAEKAGTISYELVCAVSQRVPRVYIE
ncbi:MAG: alanine racemase [Clostridiales bacterium]|jgi:alanine racemase|nr:alanine racemase [Clostridiales bacterium]